MIRLKRAVLAGAMGYGHESRRLVVRGTAATSNWGSGLAIGGAWRTISRHGWARKVIAAVMANGIGLPPKLKPYISYAARHTAGQHQGQSRLDVGTGQQCMVCRIYTSAHSNYNGGLALEAARRARGATIKRGACVSHFLNSRKNLNTTFLLTKALTAYLD